MGSNKSKRKKTTGSHSTAIAVVDALLVPLHTQKEVTKIALGIIKPGLRPAPIRIKLKRLNGITIQAKVRGANAVQEIKIYSTDLALTEKSMKRFAGKKGWLLSNMVS
jgi:hypothetical protein